MFIATSTIRKKCGPGGQPQAWRVGLLAALALIFSDPKADGKESCTGKPARQDSSLAIGCRFHDNEVAEKYLPCFAQRAILTRVDSLATMNHTSPVAPELVK